MRAFVLCNIFTIICVNLFPLKNYTKYEINGIMLNKNALIY